MNELARALVIVGVWAAALAAAAARSALLGRARRRAVRTESLRPWPAAILFTSDDCDACNPVREVLRAVLPDDEIRELSYQGDSGAFRRAGIENVPTVLMIDGRGIPKGVFEGQVSRREIRRAAGRAGVR